MPDSPARLAAVLASGEPQRLYSGLSVLVSTAADRERCAGLATFRGLELLLAEDLVRRAAEPDATPELTWAGRETFADSLVQLVTTAQELEFLSLYACSASLSTMGLTESDITPQLDGVMSTPRFLREFEGAQLLFV